MLEAFMSNANVCMCLYRVYSMNKFMCILANDCVSIYSAMAIRMYSSNTCMKCMDRQTDTNTAELQLTMAYPRLYFGTPCMCLKISHSCPYLVV